jgi:hypothetical protein
MRPARPGTARVFELHEDHSPRGAERVRAPISRPGLGTLQSAVARTNDAVLIGALGAAHPSSAGVHRRPGESERLD